MAASCCLIAIWHAENRRKNQSCQYIFYSIPTFLSQTHCNVLPLYIFISDAVRHIFVTFSLELQPLVLFICLVMSEMENLLKGRKMTPRMTTVAIDRKW